MKHTWPLTPLGDVLTVREEVPAVEDLATGAIRVVEKISFNSGRIQFRSTSATRTGMILVRPGDLLVSGINATKGAIAIYNEDADEPAAATIHYTAYIPNRERINLRFLWWMLRSRFFRQLLLEFLPGGIKTELKPKRLLPIPVPIPSLLDQQRTLAKIEELVAQLSEAEVIRKEAAEETEALVASEANALFTSERIRQWPCRTLEEVAEIRSGVTLGRRLTGPMVRLPYLRVANVQDGHLDLSEIKEIEVLEGEAEKWKLQQGDLLLTEGGDWDKLGRGAIWREEIPNCIHQNHIFRVRINRDEFVPEFLAKLIGSPVGKAYFQEASKQTTNLASINQRQLKAFKIFQPPLDEQRRIVTELDALHAEVDALRRLQNETAIELHAVLPAILDRAFKGML